MIDSRTPSSGFADFLLAELKCASLRTRLLTVEIESITVALRGGFINTDGAMNWLSEAGGLNLIAVSSAVATLASS
jgi:hypothetical protein